MAVSWTLARGGVVAIALTAGSIAYAQDMNLAALDDGPANLVSARTGAEYGFVAGVGYARALSLQGRTFWLGGDLLVPWAGIDASDYRVRVGAVVPFAIRGGFRLAGSFAPTLRGTQNDASQMTSLGADLGVVGGYYARHWFLAVETGFDWSMTTHIEHSARYRTSVYAGARDGWYANAAGNLRYGAQLGATFLRHDLVLRVGQLRGIDGSAPLLPFYGTLGFVTRW
jgi:hypothetical protein